MTDSNLRTQLQIVAIMALHGTDAQKLEAQEWIRTNLTDHWAARSIPTQKEQGPAAPTYEATPYYNPDEVLTVTHFTTYEGGLWVPLDTKNNFAKYKRSMFTSGVKFVFTIEDTKHLVHAIRFSNGEEWDRVNGFRAATTYQEPTSTENCPTLLSGALDTAKKILNHQQHVRCRLNNIRKQLESLRMPLAQVQSFDKTIDRVVYELDATYNEFTVLSRKKLTQLPGFFPSSNEHP